MANYFDPNRPEDLKLLHSSVREDPELSNIVEQVQWEIIDRFTEGTGERSMVRLAGYPDSEDLSEAMRRTIADIASWVLRDYSNEQGATSLRQGNRAITYAKVPTWRDWPGGWEAKLTRFDRRRPIYGI